MKLLTAKAIQNLRELSSDTLVITADQTKITMRLAQVVALSNFKAIAAGGRAGTGASFDAKTKTLTVALRPTSDAAAGSMRLGYDGSDVAHGFRFAGQFFEAPADALTNAAAIYPFDNFDTLAKVAKRLAGSKAKTFKSTKEAFAARKAPAAPNAARKQDMDMPMWDPSRREYYDGEMETRSNGIYR